MSEQPTARRLAWLAVGALIGLSTFLLLPGKAPPTGLGDPGGETHPSAERPGATVRATVAPGRGIDPRRAAPVAMNAGARAVSLDLDLHALAIELLPLAEAGNSEAQYSLHEILHDCEVELGRFADRAALDDQLETLPRRTGVDAGRLAQLYQSRFEACDGFRGDALERFGEPLEWLRRARDAGQVLARFAALHEQSLLAELTPEEQRTEARATVRAGLASGRPEALFETLAYEFSEVAGEDRDDLPNAVAWWLVACARGLECGPATRAWREREAYGGMPQYEHWEDMVLYDVEPHEREAARERAAEILRALDAGDLDAVLPATLRSTQP